MSFPISVDSLSGSVLASKPRAINSGVYKVTTASGDDFYLDYNKGQITKNNADSHAASVVNLGSAVSEGSLSMRTATKRFSQLREWTYGFSFTSVCEVGKPAYFVLGSGRGFSNSFLTEEVVQIEQVA